MKATSKKSSKKAQQVGEIINEVINSVPQASAEQVQTTAPTAKQGEAPVRAKLIVAQRKYDRWYVYFKGVAPKDNVGCPCKTAKSAMRYMQLLKHRHGAVISQNIYERLAFEASKEA